MSSSGLIYAVIVGAWAAYLVPMWLRRQDELNEARPTERFSTAIRLLAGRSALERRASRALGDEPRDEQSSDDGPPVRDEAAPGDPDGDPDGDPVGDPAGGGAAEVEREAEPARPAVRAPERPTGGRIRIEPRARLLARRRRMVTVLFLAFALGAVVAAVSGLAFLWVPAVPATLLTLYIGHLRKLERLRYEVKIDRARAAQAAERLRKRERQRAEARPAEEEPPQALAAAEPAGRGRSHLRLATDRDRAPAPTRATGPASASVLAEATEHEEWVDGMRERGAAGPDSWEPVPVPLPTYVTAPVAPRVTRGLDLSAPGTWTAGRPAESRPAEPRPTEGRTTPLFDQYAEPSAAESRPRAANE
ncbi:gephyrin-like molybdotransferase receptor GlpR [Kitasatospora sp. NPDC059327]|uniref:divisome protein SepX/GlpR n=1 Tax=Kitasatospora sp. NPDC059327 TaxID=3346803 RepID=UPI0036976A58